LKRTDKGFERKSLKALIRGNGISKGRKLVFLSFPILLSISDGEMEGKKVKERMLQKKEFVLLSVLKTTTIF